MNISKDNNGKLIVEVKEHKAGFEGLGAAAFPLDLNGSGASVGADIAFESAGTGAFALVVYAGLLRYLDLEPLCKAGLITKQEQCRDAFTAGLTSVKDKAVYLLAVAVLIGLLPGLGPIFGAVGLLGMGWMTTRLIRRFYACLTDDQVETLRTASTTAGVELKGMPEAKQSPSTGQVPPMDEPQPAMG